MDMRRLTKGNRTETSQAASQAVRSAPESLRTVVAARRPPPPQDDSRSFGNRPETSPWDEDCEP